MESTAECCGSSTAWLDASVCHLGDFVKDSSSGGYVLLPYFCHGEATETRIRMR